MLPYPGADKTSGLIYFDCFWKADFILALLIAFVPVSHGGDSQLELISHLLGLSTLVLASQSTHLTTSYKGALTPSLLVGLPFNSPSIQN